MGSPFVAQVTEDLNTRKILQTRETILTFTGRPPKDATHIEDLKHVIETFPHPNQDGVPSHRDMRGTVPLPVDANIWEKLTDWRNLTLDQQTETKEFLLMRYSVDDLQLAWDQYFMQNGHIPSSVQYRIFINNWRGNKSSRRTQSLVEMMSTIEKKDDEIHRRIDDYQLVQSEMDLVTHIYNGQLRNLHDLEQENQVLRNNNHHLQEEVEEEKQEVDHLKEITNVQGRHVYQLRRTIVEKDRQICEKCSRNRDLEDKKKEHESVIKKQKLIIKEKKDQVKENVSTINEQSATINEQSATINEIKVENNELKVENNEQSATINEQSATINEQSATINEIKVENNEQRATINEQSATINEIKVENNEQSATINELEEENNELKVENNEQRATINEQSATINELEVENNEQSATINELKVENNEQTTTINDLIEQNHDRSKTINELTNKIDMESHVGQTKEQIIAEQSQVIEEQKAQIEEQNERIMMHETNDKELKRQIAEQDRVNKDLYEQLEDLRMLCNKLMVIQTQRSQNQDH